MRELFQKKEISLTWKMQSLGDHNSNFHPVLFDDIDKE